MPASAPDCMDDAATDAELMVRVAAGEDTAFNVLMSRWGDRVASFLHRLTGRPDVAADLAQETFVRLYQSRNRYRPASAFPSWLFTIAVNLGRNHARWSARHPSVSLDTAADGALLAEPVDPGQSPDGAAEMAERLRAVHDAFQLLPADLREAMTLFIHEGMSYTQIASIVRCSAKAAETRIYRARQILKEKLKPILT
jgi:RNA polymerase sigma-70 factor (ECF subfamily)